MESLSADFTKRLLNQRLNQFCTLKFEDYFDTSSATPEEYYDLIFKVSMNVPREGANKQVISSQVDSLIKISRIWADFFPANTSN
uniref:hypothetical protein n=1 Tax=Escherichia coli TaxID=562 RepID=UPI001BC999E0